MKILRKRVGSLKIKEEEKKNIKIINDSIFLNDKIIFNYLPIKNLSFFLLNLEKSNAETKYWIFLDLYLDLLYKELINGKIIINREIIFDMINSSLNRQKLNNNTKIKIHDFNSTLDILNDKEFKIDNIYCFDKKFVKYGKIYFDVNKKLITVDKCKKKRIKIPSVFLLKDLSLINNSIIPSFSNLSGGSYIEDSLFIFSNKDSDLIDTEFFNYSNKFLFIFSEDLNFQMNNYFDNIENNNFIEQLKFESNNFFYSKKNIFILSNNLNEFSIKYLSFCNFENLYILDCSFDYKIESLISKLLTKYEHLRISKNDLQNNLLASNYILTNRIFRIKSLKELKYKELKLNNFPLTSWNQVSDQHFLNLMNNKHAMSQFIKIGLNNEWSNSYIEKLKNEVENNNDKCPISLLDLDMYAVSTDCNHNFNLIDLLKWLEENKECPICRSELSLKHLKFMNSPDFKELFNFIKDNKIIVIADKLWYNILNKNVNVILQSEFIINQKLKNKQNKILNLSSLSDFDIDYILDKDEDSNKFCLIKLI